ncbi:MAG: hypothetical protein OEL83_07690 [Desulforhopalus sp.]|nr:hypothetical protein [Desulforhopalus sp.]
MKNTYRQQLIGLTVLLLLLLSLSSAHSSCDRLTYAERQDSKFRKFCGHTSLTISDNHAWVVSEYAQRRFALPKEWRDKELRGAEIAAFRVEPSGRKRCHGEGDSKKCVWSFDCVLDLWIDSGTELGIKKKHDVEFKPWKSSLYILGERNPEMKAKWQNGFGLQGVALEVGGQPPDDLYTGEVIGYNKGALRKGLTLVTILIDGRATLLPPDIPRTVRFAVSPKESHLVQLPPSFWQRVLELHAATPTVTETNWRGGREEDTGLWVCSQDFADRYNMPSSRVRAELHGAEAVSYRMVPSGQSTCGYFSDTRNCTPGGLGQWSEVFDFYVDKHADLPLTVGGDFAVKFGGLSDSSIVFLGEQFQENDPPDYPWLFSYKPFKFVEFTYRIREKTGELNPKWGGGAHMVATCYTARLGAWISRSLPSINIYLLHIKAVERKIIISSLLIQNVLFIGIPTDLQKAAMK